MDSSANDPSSAVAAPGPRSVVDRRTALTGFASAGLFATSGCLRRARSVVNRTDPDVLSLTITTVPSDVDRETIRIAKILQEHLEAVGISTALDVRSIEEFLRAVYVNHDFDLFVGRHPGDVDPDYLYEALHATYAEESGMQNPYGVTDMALDERLEAQRRTDGDDRRAAVATLLESIAAEQPFVPLCVPTEHRLVRTDRFTGWTDDHLATWPGYLGLEPIAQANGDRPAALRAVVTEPRSTVNLNPLSVAYRNRGLYVDLLYDSLATLEDGAYRPWLAQSWEWEPATGSRAGERIARVTLRPDCTFHDGEPLTASDVAFTYEFLGDTTRGEGAVRSPSLRYRGQVDAVERVSVEDDRTLSIAVNAGETVGKRAFTVPILPQHVWEERSSVADVAGVRLSQAATEALVTDNVPPVGSGPFRYVAHAERETLDLERFDDHFSLAVDDLPEPTVETFSTRVEPRSTAAIEAMADGDADVTVNALESYTLADVEETADLQLRSAPSWTVYQVGFNVRHAPFSSPYFRRTVARLLDEAWLAEAVFHGHADPVATPVIGEWVPQSLEWPAGPDASDPVVPFFGTAGDLDVAAARARFDELGYRYDGEGRLLVRR